MTRNQENNPLPREIAPGVHWLGQCTGFPYQGRVLHQYASVFVVAGEDCSVIVEATSTKDQPVVERQLEELLARGVPEPKYLFVTHTEIPHAGGIGRLMARFPDAIACGEVSDLHLVFPEYADRFRPLNPGDTLPLGGRDFLVVPAVFRDLVYTRWGYDPVSKVLFTSDGFAYSHLHEQGQCGSFAEESRELDVPDQVALFAMAAFFWTQFVDIEPYIERLETLILDELDVDVIAPTHGLPIENPRETMPLITEGMRMGSRMVAAGSLLEEVE